MPPERHADPLPAACDGDYVACFRALTQLEVAIRDEGPRAPLLLRRSMLALEMGDLQRGLQAAQDAVAAAPRDAEAHFQEGLAWVARARYHAGLTVLGPGMEAPEAEPLLQILEHAYEAFCAAVRCRPDDPDAQAELTFLEGLLEHEEDDVPDLLRHDRQIA